MFDGTLHTSQHARTCKQIVYAVDMVVINVGIVCQLIRHHCLSSLRSPAITDGPIDGKPVSKYWKKNWSMLYLWVGVNCKATAQPFAQTVLKSPTLTRLPFSTLENIAGARVSRRWNELGRTKANRLVIFQYFSPASRIRLVSGFNIHAREEKSRENRAHEILVTIRLCVEMMK